MTPEQERDVWKTACELAMRGNKAMMRALTIAEQCIMRPPDKDRMEQALKAIREAHAVANGRRNSAKD